MPQRIPWICQPTPRQRPSYGGYDGEGGTPGREGREVNQLPINGGVVSFQVKHVPWGMVQAGQFKLNNYNIIKCKVAKMS